MLYLLHQVKFAQELVVHDHVDIAGLIYRVQKVTWSGGDNISLELVLSNPSCHSVAELHIPKKAMMQIIRVADRPEYSQE